MAYFTNVKNNYTTITQLLTQARNLLITKLNNKYVTGVNNYTIFELIEAVNDIETIEYYNDNNEKPKNTSAIVVGPPYDYNEGLFLRISYYMELLAYYLVEKGVPTYMVNQQTTLFGLINLIDEIYAKKPVTMTIQEPESYYYFGEDIILEYDVIDCDGNQANNGEITILLDGILYDSIEMGETLKFKPSSKSIKINNEYEPIICTITYNGSSDYQAYSSIDKEIIVYPQRVNITINPINRNTMSKYYMDTYDGYINDEWTIQVITNITSTPFKIYIDNTLIDEYITHETTGKYLIRHTFTQTGTHTIRVVTTYDDIDYAINTEKTYTIQIHYFPLYQVTNSYTDYAGKDTYTYSIKIRDEDTGNIEVSNLDNREISLFLNNNYIDNIIIESGIATAEIPLLGVGQHTLTWSINNNIATTNINILSNFILPNNNIFYANDTPDIIYAPLNTNNHNSNNWTPVQNKKVTGRITYELDGISIVDDVEWYTNNQGILHKLKEYTDISEYTIRLTTASDSLNEDISYTYIINEPFEVSLINYQEKIQAVYNIKIYDKEHYISGQYSTYIAFDNNIINECSFLENEYDDYYDITIVIPTNSNTVGQHTMTVSINGYSQTYNFALYTQIFSLPTQSISVGTQNIQIQCADSSINNISLNGDYINVISITKTNDGFTCQLTFTKAGNRTLTVSTNSDTENLTFTVDKADIATTLQIKKNNTVITECEYGNTDNVYVAFNIAPRYEDMSISYVVNNTPISTTTCNASNTSTNVSFPLPSRLTPGQHTINIIYTSNSNSSYNSFNVSTTLTITKANPNYQISNQYSGYVL